jgi:hypothetical protein
MHGGFDAPAKQFRQGESLFPLGVAESPGKLESTFSLKALVERREK